MAQVWPTCRVAEAASCSLFSLADSVMKPFWKMYCFSMFGSITCTELHDTNLPSALACCLRQHTTAVPTERSMVHWQHEPGTCVYSSPQQAGLARALACTAQAA